MGQSYNEKDRLLKPIDDFEFRCHLVYILSLEYWEDEKRWWCCIFSNWQLFDCIRNLENYAEISLCRGGAEWDLTCPFAHSFCVLFNVVHVVGIDRQWKERRKLKCWIITDFLSRFSKHQKHLVEFFKCWDLSCENLRCFFPIICWFGEWYLHCRSHLQGRWGWKECHWSE